MPWTLDGRWILLICLFSTPAFALERWFKPIHAELGEALYRDNCSVCHGLSGEGAKNWRQPDAQEFMPAPPLNGTGHAWHHPLKSLYQTIMQGSPGGRGNMPAWAGRLNQERVLAIIAWFQSQWTDEIYAAWYRMDQASKK